MLRDAHDTPYLEAAEGAHDPHASRDSGPEPLLSPQARPQQPSIAPPSCFSPSSCYSLILPRPNGQHLPGPDCCSPSMLSLSLSPQPLQDMAQGYCLFSILPVSWESPSLRPPHALWPVCSLLGAEGCCRQSPSAAVLRVSAVTSRGPLGCKAGVGSCLLSSALSPHLEIGVKVMLGTTSHRVIKKCFLVKKKKNPEK